RGVVDSLTSLEGGNSIRASKVLPLVDVLRSGFLGTPGLTRLSSIGAGRRAGREGRRPAEPALQDFWGPGQGHRNGARPAVRARSQATRPRGDRTRDPELTHSLT